MPSPTEIRRTITDLILTALKSNALPPWRKPWGGTENTGHPCNAVSRRCYSGVNPLALNVAAARHGFTSKWWATYRQWEALGGQVRRRPADVPAGRWGTQVVFCKPVSKRKADDDGGKAEDKFWVLRSFTAFNLDQVDGPFDHLRAGTVPLLSHEVQGRCEHADAVIEATGADIRYGGGLAAYDRVGDFIRLPRRSQFVRPEYYETAFHELTHWSEHPARLNWDRAAEGYAMGELVAELGGCYMAGELGLPVGDNLANHAAYVKSWLGGMQNDTRFVFTAAAQASRAVDYLLSFSRPQVVPEMEEAAA